MFYHNAFFKKFSLESFKVVSLFSYQGSFVQRSLAPTSLMILSFPVSVKKFIILFFKCFENQFAHLICAEAVSSAHEVCYQTQAILSTLFIKIT